MVASAGGHQGVARDRTIFPPIATSITVGSQRGQRRRRQPPPGCSRSERRLQVTSPHHSSEGKNGVAETPLDPFHGGPGGRHPRPLRYPSSSDGLRVPLGRACRRRHTRWFGRRNCNVNLTTCAGIVHSEIAARKRGVPSNLQLTDEVLSVTELVGEFPIIGECVAKFGITWRVAHSRGHAERRIGACEAVSLRGRPSLPTELVVVTLQPIWNTP